MAVYEHSYRRYTGELTDSWKRFLVIPRYSMEMLLKSRRTLVAMVLFLLPPLVASAFIYFSNNDTVQQLFAALGEMSDILTVGPSFFLGFTAYQMVCTFLLAVFVAPQLTSSDLRNNALPLYLSRPLTRTEYVGAKLFVIVALLSVISWVPLLMLWVLQASMHTGGWASENLGLIPAIVGSAGLWIAQLALVGLAISVWVKWKAIARLSIFGVFFGSSAVGELVNALFISPEGRNWGSLVDISALNERVWRALFQQPVEPQDIPLAAALFMIFLVCAISVYLLSRKVRAYEVV